MVQLELERDDAYTKRDSAFRQLQEAKDEIEALKIKLENAPISKQTLDISPSDKLAQMVKESLADKVNRGLARWNIPSVPTPENNIVPLDIPVQEVHNDVSTPSDQVHQTDSGAVTEATGNQNVEPLVGKTEETTVTRTEHEALKVAHEALTARVNNIEQHLPQVA
jgi:hypothetical protein